MNISKAITDIRDGRPIIVVDDYTRENEADIMIAAEKANIHNVLFAMNHAKGLMCIPTIQPVLDRLEIPLMCRNNRDKLGTPFTVSVDAVEGTTTGMSLYDRLKTISVLVDENSKPEQLAQPGHLFPLRANNDLLKGRRGHTESSIELTRLAKLKPVAIIVEIMDNIGGMVKGKQVNKFAERFGLNIISVEEIYQYVYH